MQSAAVGLNFDVSGFRQGIRDANQAVREGLTPRSLEPFDKGVKSSAKTMRTEFSSAIGYLGSAFAALGITATLGGLGAALKEFTKDAVEQSNKLADAATSLSAALRAAKQPEGKLGELEQAAATLGTGLGISRVESTNAMSTLIGQGATPNQAVQLAVLAATYSKKNNLPFEQTVKLVAEAARGKAKSALALGIEAQATGDPRADGAAYIAELARRYPSDVGLAMTNDDERRDQSYEDLKLAWGDNSAPVVNAKDRMLGDFYRGLAARARGDSVRNYLNMRNPADLARRRSQNQFNLMTAIPTAGASLMFNEDVFLGQLIREREEARIANAGRYNITEGFSLPPTRAIDDEEETAPAASSRRTPTRADLIKRAENDRRRMAAQTRVPMEEGTKIVIVSKSPNRFARSAGGP